MNDRMLRSAAVPGKSNSGFSSQGSLAQVQTTGRRDLPGDVAIDAIACCQTVTMSQSVLVVIAGLPSGNPPSVNSSSATGISCQSHRSRRYSVPLEGVSRPETTFPSDSLPLLQPVARLILTMVARQPVSQALLFPESAKTGGRKYLLCGSVTPVPGPLAFQRTDRLEWIPAPTVR